MPNDLMTSLEEKIKQAVEKVNNMSPEEKEKMQNEQRAAYVAAELSWPKPKFKMIDGVKVYDSYEDYING